VKFLSEFGPVRHLSHLGLFPWQIDLGSFVMQPQLLGIKGFCCCCHVEWFFIFQITILGSKIYLCHNHGFVIPKSILGTSKHIWFGFVELVWLFMTFQFLSVLFPNLQSQE
jgi:hypothetical protein